MKLTDRKGSNFTPLGKSNGFDSSNNNSNFTNAKTRKKEFKKETQEVNFFFSFIIKIYYIFSLPKKFIMQKWQLLQ